MSRSRNLKMVAAAFCAIRRTAGGWLPWVWRWGYNSKPHAHLACGCAGRSHQRERLCHACVRCGQCVQACPYDALKLATLASGLSAGTPYFVARDIPCEMCEDIRTPESTKRCAGSSLNQSTTRGWGWRYWSSRKTVSTFRGCAAMLLSRMPKIDEAVSRSWTQHAYRDARPSADGSRRRLYRLR